jgi:NAD+ diphosphatase
MRGDGASARLGFTGSPIDRAEPMRRDEAALAALRDHPGARWLAMEALRPVMAIAHGAPRLAWRAGRPPDDAVLLGLLGDAPCFVAPGAPAGDAERSIDARSAAAQCPADDAAIIAQARSLLDWHERHPFCAACGSPTALRRGGQIRACPGCGAEHYPRVDPVAIMLVVDGAGRALLGRGPRMPPGFVSALAGYVEPGESLEEAVRREIREESGVVVGAVRYLASQPWPFGSQLMLGCIARATTTAIIIDPAEIEEAFWASRADVEHALAGAGPFQLPPPLAIARTLIDAWLDGAKL